MDILLLLERAQDLAVIIDDTFFVEGVTKGKVRHGNFTETGNNLKTEQNFSDSDQVY